MSNSGSAATSGLVQLADSLPSGLTASSLSGTGWSCTLSTLICTRSDSLAAGGSYPVVTLTVSVASNAPASVTNGVTVSGGGETNTGNDIAYDPTTISSSPPSGPATMASPTPGTQLTGSAVTFTWNAGAGATQYWLNMGTAGVNSTDIFNSNMATSQSQQVTALPVDGSTVYVRLWSFMGSSNLWQWNDYTYAAYIPSGGGGRPDLMITKSHTGNFTQGQSGNYTIIVTNNGTAPTSGSVQVSDVLPTGLTPSALSGTSPWSCDISTLTCTRTDALNVGASYSAITLTVNVAATASSPLTNTANVVGRGDSNSSNDSWSDSTIVNPAPSGPKATMATPVPGSTLMGPSVRFTWNPGQGATQYYLYAGTFAGGNDLWSQSEGLATTDTVTDVPTSGTLYVRLWTLNNTWLYNDYTYPLGAASTGTTKEYIRLGGRVIAIEVKQ